MVRKITKTLYLTEENIEGLDKIKYDKNFNNLNQVITELLRTYNKKQESQNEEFNQLKRMLEINTELLTALCLEKNINHIDFTYKKGYSSPYNEAKKRLEEFDVIENAKKRNIVNDIIL